VFCPTQPILRRNIPQRLHRGRVRPRTCSGQNKLFYSFNLDNHVPREHLLRGIDHFLNLSDLRRHLTPYYSPMRRPSIDPELMIRALIVGYCFEIRSERRLCEEAHLNLAYR
jgi:transposase